MKVSRCDLQNILIVRCMSRLSFLWAPIVWFFNGLSNLRFGSCDHFGLANQNSSKDLFNIFAFLEHSKILLAHLLINDFFLLSIMFSKINFENILKWLLNILCTACFKIHVYFDVDILDISMKNLKLEK